MKEGKRESVMRREIIVCVASVLGLGSLVAACSSSSLPACEVTEAAAVPEDIAGYTLGPGERVRVTVFRHEQLSGEFQVDGSGSVSLPLIGDVPAQDLTTRQLETRIADTLKNEGYLVNPRVSVEVMTYRPFYILGEVNNPGQYEYTNGMTVTNAVALAGGYTYRADGDDIEIRRSGCAVSADATTQVLPGEVVFVPERFF
jgi:protein involved in polysaccharide export with SLBB domain